MNIGTIQGGTGINVLAAEAKCELDLRSEDPRTLAELDSTGGDYAYEARSGGCEGYCGSDWGTPCGRDRADHPLVKLAVDCLAEQGVSARFLLLDRRMRTFP
jgi:metal-dependent amidase/aminoacylase/carboxypeptidase family protein